MKYNKQSRIWGTDMRMRSDRVRRVLFNSSGVRVDTIKGKSVVWYWRAPLSLLRFISNI